MSDDALNWDDWGFEEKASTAMLRPGTYRGTIKVAQWKKEDWVARKYPEVNPEGWTLTVKVEIDCPQGYAEAWKAVPRHMRAAVQILCDAAGVEKPVKDGPPWSPSILLGTEVTCETSIYENPNTGESKVQIDRWVLPERSSKPAAKPAANKATAKRTPLQKADAVANETDDIPF
jgi:hypothetical protein